MNTCRLARKLAIVYSSHRVLTSKCIHNISFLLWASSLFSSFIRCSLTHLDYISKAYRGLLRYAHSLRRKYTSNPRCIVSSGTQAIQGANQHKTPQYCIPNMKTTCNVSSSKKWPERKRSEHYNSQERYIAPFSRLYGFSSSNKFKYLSQCLTMFE